MTTNPEPIAPITRQRVALRLRDRRLEVHRARMAETSERIGFHTKVLALAVETFGAGNYPGRSHPEIDRAQAALAEWEAELDDVIEAAADAGYGPEDFED